MTAAAAHAFLAASDLPARWQGVGRFVVLDTEFRGAERFLACWHAWRLDQQSRRAQAHRQDGSAPFSQLHFIAIATRMPGAGELQARWVLPAADESTAPAAPFHAPAARSDGPPLPISSTGPPAAPISALAIELIADWPPAVPGLHRLAFDGGMVQLLLAAGGGARQWLPQLSARVDAFFVDGETLTTDCDRAWPLRLFKAACRLATPGATLVVPAPGEAARKALRAAGFEPSAGRHGDSLAAASNGAAAAGVLWRGRHAPTFVPRRATHHRPAAGSPPSASSERHALIVGAGLAGCAVAWALAELGWHSTLLDRHDAPAREASGNPGGLFHGVVHPQDGAHARFNRAAALEAGRAVRTAVARHGVLGDTGGLLRVESAGFAAPPGKSSVHEGSRQAGLPADYARIVDAAEASALAGIPIAHPCWHFPGGGWVQPAGLARAFLERCGARANFVGAVPVASLRRCEHSALRDAATGAGHAKQAAASRARWQLIDPIGRVLGESAVVVLAHAGDASKLLTATATSAAQPGRTAAPVQGTPLQTVRGQLSVLPVAGLPKALPGLALPRLPLVGSGWLLPAVDGLAVFGATAQPDDPDPALRGADHAANVAALGRLTGLRFADDPPPALQGRTAWRCVTPDRLPLIGAVPCRAAGGDGNCSGGADRMSDAEGARRTDRTVHDNHLAREPGLYTFSALGSRGITWAALGGQVLASLITGAPVPVSRGLLDAVDPGRFLLRRQRRGHP